MDAITTTVATLGNLDADLIVSALTKSGSEFQKEVIARNTKTPIAIVRDGGCRIVAWAATHEWRGMQTIEGFTAESHRRRGIATLAAAMLVASGSIDTTRPVAIFSPHCIEIAMSVGCRDVRLFERHGDEWIENS
jgi:hypothetical protein